MSDPDTQSGNPMDYDDPDGRLKEKYGVTTCYGVSLRLERDSKHQYGSRRHQYWSPAPASKEEAIQMAREHYDDEIEHVYGVETEEKHAPAKWDDDDSRIREWKPESANAGGA